MFSPSLGAELTVKREPPGFSSGGRAVRTVTIHRPWPLTRLSPSVLQILSTLQAGPEQNLGAVLQKMNNSGPSDLRCQFQLLCSHGHRHPDAVIKLMERAKGGGGGCCPVPQRALG